MARFDHLKIIRLPERLPRRKKPGWGTVIERDPANHGAKLKADLEKIVNNKIKKRSTPSVNPSLILRVKMKGGMLEEEWEKLGLSVLSSNSESSLILFSSNADIQDLQDRLTAYSQGTPPDQKHPQYAAFVSSIEEIGDLGPEDRIGPRLKVDGYMKPEDFRAKSLITVDIELWDLGTRYLRQQKVDEITEWVEARESVVFESYLGPSITMLRVEVPESEVPSLLDIAEISSIDLPPQPDLITDEVTELTLKGIPGVGSIDDDSPVIGVIDSGINSHPLLTDIVAGSIAVPEDLGEADDVGHGTRVSGIAVYGDLQNQLDNGILQPGARLCSAKVVNGVGKFPKEKLVPSQMRTAIEDLHRRFGCRIFVISLGLPDQPYDDGKVGPWAATLDELVSELSIVIIVSAGNRSPRGGVKLEEAVTKYPKYLMEDNNRVLEPASALNVITVGGLAHGEGIDKETAEYVTSRPITRRGQPSPFTRVGPGVGGACKPDVVDYGGTLVFDPVTMQLRNAKTLSTTGMLTLHHKPIDRLFTTGSGTSYAAPLVGFKAAQILKVLPAASGNLVRALLGISASISDEARVSLTPFGDKTIRNVCGNGVVDLERAAYSDDGRVALYAEDSLAVDHFAVFEVPIPEEFQATKGRRHIRVSLAYDPPVRHSRLDYAGIKMSFRLIRGSDPDFVFEHFRQREKAEGKFPELPHSLNCALKPGPEVRERSSLQVASQMFSRDISKYGDKYYLIVRCEGRWAKEMIDSQKYAVVVELSHEAEIPLYQRVRVRVRA